MASDVKQVGRASKFWRDVGSGETLTGNDVGRPTYHKESGRGGSGYCSGSKHLPKVATGEACDNGCAGRGRDERPDQRCQHGRNHELSNRAQHWWTEQRTEEIA